MAQGSSTVPSSLVITNYTFVTGPTGNTGPDGPTGFSVTGPVGQTGPQFVSAIISGSSIGITYGSVYVNLPVSAPTGGVRLENPQFFVGETGASDAISVFGGYTLSDPYKLLFKTIRVVGSVTAGISLDSFYISSPSTKNQK